MERVLGYYARFDEWSRLDAAPGRLEFLRALEEIERFVPRGARVLDLGGGPGRYTIALAERGYVPVLADASAAQLDVARTRLAEAGQTAEVVLADARDLGRWQDGSFDAVLAFGPFYHLIDADDRRRAAGEIQRVLRPGGTLLAQVLPFESGLRGIIARAAAQPAQVAARTWERLLDDGVFVNESDRGFQDGWYPKLDEVRALFTGAGFDELAFVSLRGLGADQEQAVLALRETKPHLFERVMQTIRDTAADPGVVALGSHAVWVGRAPPAEPE